MKKTIIALLALAGAASADEVKPITLTATFNANKTATFNLDDFKVVDLTLVNTANGEVLNSMDATANDIMPDRLRPNINVDAGNSWTLGFTVSNSGANDLTVNSLTLSAFAFNSGGDVQANNRNFLFTVSAGDKTIASDTNLYIAGDSENGATLTINLTDALTLSGKGDLDFTIVVKQGAEGNNGRGAFLGLIGAAINK